MSKKIARRKEEVRLIEAYLAQKDEDSDRKQRIGEICLKLHERRCGSRKMQEGDLQRLGKQMADALTVYLEDMPEIKFPMSTDMLCLLLESDGYYDTVCRLAKYECECCSSLRERLWQNMVKLGLGSESGLDACKAFITTNAKIIKRFIDEEEVKKA